MRGTSGHISHTTVQTTPGTDTERHQECLRAAPSHDVVLRDNNIPQLCKSWDENITDLVSEIVSVTWLPNALIITLLVSCIH
jgi:hypothetical protein